MSTTTESAPEKMKYYCSRCNKKCRGSLFTYDDNKNKIYDCCTHSPQKNERSMATHKKRYEADPEYRKKCQEIARNNYYKKIGPVSYTHLRAHET